MQETSNRRIVIGDVHGHYNGLMGLLEAIAPGKEDEIYFIGDLIDRGPQSSKVVEFVKQNATGCILGNHEQMLIDVVSGGAMAAQVQQSWLYSGGYATITSYPDSTIPEEHLEWMKKLPIYLDLGDVLLVHAGVDPRMPLEAQTSEQLCWIRDEFHSMEEPYFSDKLIVIGHTITFTLPGVTPGKLAQGQGWIDIDTGAYHPKSGWLTGFDITNNQVYQFNVHQQRSRILTLNEAVTSIEPTKIKRR